jgi:hypothetical protein
MHPRINHCGGTHWVVHDPVTWVRRSTSLLPRTELQDNTKLIKVPFVHSITQTLQLACWSKESNSDHDLNHTMMKEVALLACSRLEDTGRIKQCCILLLPPSWVCTAVQKVEIRP